MCWAVFACPLFECPLQWVTHPSHFPILSASRISCTGRRTLGKKTDIMSRLHYKLVRFQWLHDGLNNTETKKGCGWGAFWEYKWRKKCIHQGTVPYIFTFLELHSDLSSKNMCIGTHSEVERARKILQIYLPTELFSAVYWCQNVSQMDLNGCLSPSHPLQSENVLRNPEVQPRIIFH